MTLAYIIILYIDVKYQTAFSNSLKNQQKKKNRFLEVSQIELGICIYF